VKACDCGQIFVDLAADRGIAVKASSEPLSNPYGFEDLDMLCPHGVRWYAIPTAEQIAAWRRDGVR
jgi:hypothetical protein